ncbi:hypothetical protein MBAV_000950 [Candidatus Magnetobacterium bavaricum]|uniref:Uncharacterized protein n=1 Tax=Candidatus Magnetobacterium bavaricum TaxID=29290 RepID=A0A0F3GYB1_9BACT|nr:hypothetical protein MBAV_000950 [Candidatus Magnetobacterium bavaricum]
MYVSLGHGENPRLRFLSKCVLSGWPVHGPAADYMQVDVVDALSGLGVAVDDHPKPALIDPPVPGNPPGHLKHVSDECGVLSGHIQDRGDVFPGDDENMHRRLWVEVLKGHRLVVLVHHRRPYLFVRYLTEYTIHNLPPKA